MTPPESGMLAYAVPTPTPPRTTTPPIIPYAYFLLILDLSPARFSMVLTLPGPRPQVKVLAVRCNIAYLETLQNTRVEWRVSNQAAQQENRVTERSVNNRPCHRNIILNHSHFPRVIHMRPCLRQLVGHKQRSALAHPRVNSQLHR